MALLKRARADSAVSSQQASDGQGGEEDSEPWGGFSHPVVDENMQLDSANTDKATAAAREDINIPMGEGDGQITSIPPRRSTRDSTRGRRPGKDIGLRWREANAEEAAEKAERARKQAASQGRKNSKAQQVVREEEGVQKIAALEAQRARADRTDAEYVKAANASGYHETSPTHSDSGPSGSEYDDHQTERNVEDDVYEFDDLEGGSSAQGTAKLPKKKLTEAEKRKERQKTVLGRIKTAGNELDNEDDARASRPNRSSRSKPSIEATTGSVSTKAKTAARAGVKSVSASGTGNFTAFNPAYRAKLLAGSSRGTPSPSQQHLSAFASSHPPLSLKPRTSTSSLASSAPTPSHSPSPSPTSTPSRPSALRLPSLMVTRPQSTSRSSTNMAEDAALGGFEDQDIQADMEVVVARPKGRYPEMTEIVEIEEDAEVKIKKAKIPRTLKVDMDAKTSLSAERALPQWLYALLDSSIMPTLVEYYGSQQDPWTVDSDDEDSGLRALIQQLIDTLCPRREYDVAKAAPVVKIARQRLGNWRRGFMNRAHTTVAKAYKDVKKQNPRAPMPAVARWAQEGLDLRKGEAFWESAAVGEETKGTGKLLSVYVLRVFAPHLQLIVRSELNDHLPPIGAICLACAAVEIAFECYRTGVYKSPTEPFDKKNAGDRTDSFHDDAVKGFVNTPDEYDAFLEKVRPFVDRLSPAKSALHVSKRRRRTMGSSPPPESD